jgi:hypothetical protein
MKKLKLNLDDLQVESFETTPASATQRGTVHGYRPYTDTCGTPCTAHPQCTAECGGQGDTDYVCTNDCGTDSCDCGSQGFSCNPDDHTCWPTDFQVCH